ncbi:hypothetical protein PoB_002112700 [Plakobranchus ocellatus]|uniref:Uncharacterized protein n=1 Tax=Plakobranchus ocellatus TaxID=259542 RepID=A0AAV3ZH21_9GAST|nr:hypothetical protein PoB_002112700 [Plakobranchus ocellatus]
MDLGFKQQGKSTNTVMPRKLDLDKRYPPHPRTECTVSLAKLLTTDTLSIRDWHTTYCACQTVNTVTFTCSALREHEEAEEVDDDDDDDDDDDGKRDKNAEYCNKFWLHCNYYNKYITQQYPIFITTIIKFQQD